MGRRGRGRRAAENMLHHGERRAAEPCGRGILDSPLLSPQLLSLIKDSCTTCPTEVESGHIAVVRVLLDAGVSPTTMVPGRPGGKNPLHIACEAGQEEAAMLLLGSTASLEAVAKPDGKGRAPAELLRQMDMAGIARRLETAAAVRFADDDNAGSGDMPAT